MTGHAEQGWKRLAEAIKRAEGLVPIDPEGIVSEHLDEGERSLQAALDEMKVARGKVKDAIEQAVAEISEEVARANVAWAHASFVIDKLARQRGLEPGSAGYDNIWGELEAEFSALPVKEIAMHLDSANNFRFDASEEAVQKILAACEAQEPRGGG